MGRTLRKSAASERGAELIEFALALPLLLVIIMGIFDFGLAFQRYEILTNAAREGARLGSLQATYSQADIEDRVLDYVEAAGLDRDDVTPLVTMNQDINLASGATVPGVRVQVAFTHQFSFVGPIMALIGADSLTSVTLRATSTMRREGIAAAGS